MKRNKPSKKRWIEAVEGLYENFDTKYKVRKTFTKLQLPEIEQQRI